MSLRSVVYDHDFDNEANRIFGGARAADDALRAVEFKLAREPDLSQYPETRVTALGPLRYITTMATPTIPGVVVLFTHDDRIGRVCCHSIRETVPRPFGS